MNSKKRVNDRTGELDPGRLYSLPAFKRITGLGETTLFQARRRGLRLRTLKVGRRKFVRGLDGIAFIETLAEQGTS